jgi:methylmalonyl-CoA mutase
MDSKKKDPAKLFSEFPPVLTEQWEEKIKKDLKGADYDKKLIWKTNENFNLKPYYRSEDLKDISYLDDVFPGDFPFARGNKKNKNDWYIRQDIDAKDIKKANIKALDILKELKDFWKIFLPTLLNSILFVAIIRIKFWK